MPNLDDILKGLENIQLNHELTKTEEIALRIARKIVYFAGQFCVDIEVQEKEARYLFKENK